MVACGVECLRGGAAVETDVRWLSSVDVGWLGVELEEVGCCVVVIGEGVDFVDACDGGGEWGWGRGDGEGSGCGSGSGEGEACGTAGHEVFDEGLLGV